MSLLKIEWIKLKNYRTFWILSILFIISIYGLNFMANRIHVKTTQNLGKGNIGKAVLGTPPFAFPDVWQTVAYMSSFLLFIPGLLVIISITNEFSFKTHRQNIVDGWSRDQFIGVKLILVLLTAIASTIIVAIMAFVFGVSESAPLSFEKFEYIGYFFIQALSYCSVALVFSLLLKRSGLAIGVYFLYTVVLENLIGGILDHYTNKAGTYLPLNSTDALIPFPFLRRITSAILDKPNYSILLPLSLAYLIVYFIFSFQKFRSDDL